MIVRDEAGMLPDFLRCAEGLWDELIVVDTGSVDATVDILKEAGATVSQRAWDDDFAAARNAGLELATGEWIAFFDADERVSPKLVGQLRALVTDLSTDAGAATIIMQNRHPSGHLHTSPLLRVFRNDPAIRFEHRIHEDISAPVAEHLQRMGRRLVTLSGTVEHLGYIREVAAAKDKRERDLRLLEACLSEDPSDLYSHYKLMEQARYWHDDELWEDAAQAADAEMRRADPALIRSLHFGGELAVLTAQGIFPSDAKAALVWLEPWEAKITTSAAFYYWRGHLRELVGQLESALLDYERCLDLGGTRNVQLATVRPLMGMVRIALSTGNLRDARELTIRALEFNIVDDEIAIAARALADMALVDGDGPAAAQLMAPVAGDPPRGADGITLGRALMLAGDIFTCRDVVADMVDTLPEAGIGLLMCDLCLAQDSNLTLDLSQGEADQAMRAWIDVVLRSKNLEIPRGFLANAGAITGVFPWLQPYVFDILGIEQPAQTG
jgi:glycosyltransferase involved in cell wall biosynthesis